MTPTRSKKTLQDCCQKNKNGLKSVKSKDKSSHLALTAELLSQLPFAFSFKKQKI